MLQDNDPNYTSRSTKEWLKKKKKRKENMFFPSPDLKPLQMLWHNLKKHVLSKQPRNIDKLKQIFVGRDGPKLFKIRKKKKRKKESE